MTKLNIVRMLGESEPDFWRRYHREKLRIYRARKPKLPRKPKSRNKSPERNSLLTQEQWESLQPREGETREDWKRRYNRERQAILRARDGNKAKELARRRELYAANIETERAKSRAKHAANPERQREYDRRQREKDPQKAAQRLAKLTDWGKQNPDRLRAAIKEWNAANRALMNSYSAQWRRSCRVATPPWANFEEIRRFYERAKQIEAETGIPHHVDHIVPVQGDDVCGLHVQTNLRVIPSVENMKKRNRLDHELVERLMWEDYWDVMVLAAE